MLTVSSKYMQWIILIGILMMQTTPVPLAIGVALFGLTTLFSFITLPVEFDASNRAKQLLVSHGIVGDQEMPYVNGVLNAAAWTYVAATLQSVLTLLYYVMMFTGGGRDE